MAKIFVAYSSKDMRLLTRLRDELERRSPHTLFIAEWDVPYGEIWREQIQTNLDLADFFVPLLSRNFLQSEEAKRELHYAIRLADEKKLRVIPVLIEDLKGDELPYYIADRQYIRYQPFDAMISELIKALPRVHVDESALSAPQDLIDYTKRKELSPQEMVDLARQALKTTWGQPSEWGRAAKDIADRLWNQGNSDEALEIYDALIERFPLIDSLRISRSSYRLKLRDYQGADDDCAAVLQRDPENIKALIQRFWVRWEWANSMTTPEQQREHIQIVENCLETLGSIRAALTTFLPGYLHVLAAGAELCRNISYAEKARLLIDNNKERLKKEKIGAARRAILNCLKILERFYQNIGEADKVEKLKAFRESLEDNWKLYKY